MKKNKSKQMSYRGYLHIPKVMWEHADFISLTPHALKLLIDLAGQYSGFNNGDLCATFSIMKHRGWSSRDTLFSRLDELVKAGWIIKTKSGGLGIGPNLYAITWQPIDECRGKLDVKSTTNPPRSFKD